MKQQDSLLKLHIKELAYGGMGKAIHHGKTFLVEGPVVPGDQVLAERTLTKKSFVKCRLRKWVTFAQSRIKPPCPVFEKCGGCDLQMLAYPEQLAIKQQMVKEALDRIGSIQVQDIPFIPTQQEYHYRNKIIRPVLLDGKQITTGFFKKKSQQAIPIQDCLLEHPLSHTIQKSFIKHANSKPFKRFLKAYYAPHKGFLRNLVIRIGIHAKEAMVIFVTTSEFDHKKGHTLLQNLGKAVQADVPEVMSCFRLINDNPEYVPLDGYPVHLFGSRFILEYLEQDESQLSFAIVPQSFFQVNTLQTQKLYQKALELMNPYTEDIVLDLFAGTGTISCWIAKHVRRVYGVELEKAAIDIGYKNIQHNKCKAVKLLHQDALEGYAMLANQGIMPAAIVLDPPRKGCDAPLLHAIGNSECTKIIYISCNPATFARDAKRLKRHGFSVVQMYLADMFPQTYHVECVALLVRQVASTILIMK